jgi:hypothetical protein
MVKVLKSKQFWGILIALGLLIYCLKDVRLSDLDEIWHRTRPLYGILATIASFAYVVGRGIRWRLLVSQQKKIPLSRAITLYSAGQVVNTVMPALTGQVGRVFLFSKKEGLPKSGMFSTVILEILFDAVALILILFFGSAIVVIPSEYQTAGIVLTAATTSGLALLYLFLHFRAPIERVCERRIGIRWPSAFAAIRKFIASFTKGIELLKSSGHLIGGIGLSLCQWLFHILVIYFLFKSFGFHLSLASAALVMIINTIALLVPITPANAGTFEVVVSTSLRAFGVGQTDAVLCALTLHLVDLMPIVVLGLFYFRVEKMSLSEIKKEHEDDKILDKISDEGTFIEESRAK